MNEWIQDVSNGCRGWKPIFGPKLHENEAIWSQMEEHTQENFVCRSATGMEINILV